jgi:hypothetical protein
VSVFLPWCLFLILIGFSTFLPLTFPVERNSQEEVTLRRQKILKSKKENLAVFLGMMATVAAFRAIFLGRHDDLKPSDKDHNDLLHDTDFKVIKAWAMEATRARIETNNSVDEGSVEAIFSLIGAASILGNFDEARLHLRAIRKVLHYNSDLVDLTSPQSHWIPLTDVKAAVGMLRRPYFRLPWSPDPIPDDLLRKIVPPPSAALSQLGSAFLSLRELSIAMQQLLRDAVCLCWFSQFNHERSHDLNAADHEVLRRKTLELEYELLSYVYQGAPTDTDQIPNDMMHSPLEKMIRLAVLGMVSSTLTNVLPSAGVGRALTQHQLKATNQYFNLTLRPVEHEAAAIIWIMLQYAQGAANQVEEHIFLETLNACRELLRISYWSQIEHLVFGHLYIPAEQTEKWRSIWESAISPTPAKNDFS